MLATLVQAAELKEPAAEVNEYPAMFKFVVPVLLSEIAPVARLIVISGELAVARVPVRRTLSKFGWVKAAVSTPLITDRLTPLITMRTSCPANAAPCEFTLREYCKSAILVGKAPGTMSMVANEPGPCLRPFADRCSIAGWARLRRCGADSHVERVSLPGLNRSDGLRHELGRGVGIQVHEADLSSIERCRQRVGTVKPVGGILDSVVAGRTAQKREGPARAQIASRSRFGGAVG